MLGADSFCSISCASFFHLSWTCAIQFVEVVVILLCTIGVTSLAGIAVAILALPFQYWTMHQLFAGRQKSMKWTDSRIKLISELRTSPSLLLRPRSRKADPLPSFIVSGIKIIKLFAWEKPYNEKVHNLRQHELV